MLQHSPTLVTLTPVAKHFWFSRLGAFLFPRTKRRTQEPWSYGEMLASPLHSKSAAREHWSERLRCVQHRMLTRRNPKSDNTSKETSNAQLQKVPVDRSKDAG